MPTADRETPGPVPQLFIIRAGPLPRLHSLLVCPPIPWMHHGVDCFGRCLFEESLICGGTTVLSDEAKRKLGVITSVIVALRRSCGQDDETAVRPRKLRPRTSPNRSKILWSRRSTWRSSEVRWSRTRTEPGMTPEDGSLNRGIYDELPGLPAEARPGCLGWLSNSSRGSGRGRISRQSRPVRCLASCPEQAGFGLQVLMRSSGPKHDDLLADLIDPSSAAPEHTARGVGELRNFPLVNRTSMS